MEMSFFDNHRLGETLAMLNDDVNQLERFLNRGFNQLFQMVILFFFSGVTLFITRWELALVGMVPIPIVVWTSLWCR
jgi:ATP-binding cassette subfamily B protein